MASHDRGLIAITGANGTIGYACTLYALKTGYRVRCIVRREAAITTIRSGPSMQAHADRVEYAIVPDNALDGAYDEAFDSVQYVVHIAGVWPKPHYHPDNDIYHPFVKSMHNVLSAAKRASSVRKVVFTQAAAALINPNDGDTLGRKMDRILNEWTNLHPPSTTSHHAYCAAKATCMAHLKQVQQTSSNSPPPPPFAIAQILPGTVLGPSELITTTAAARTSHLDRMTRALLFDDAAPRYAFGFVHVDDCAQVHIEALDAEMVPLQGSGSPAPMWYVAAAATSETESEGEVGGGGSAGEEVWRRGCEVVEREFGEEVESGVLRVGWGRVPVNMPFRVESGVTEGLLLGGRKFRSFGEGVREVGEWYLGLRRGEEEEEEEEGGEGG